MNSNVKEWVAGIGITIAIIVVVFGLATAAVYNSVVTNDRKDRDKAKDTQYRVACVHKSNYQLIDDNCIPVANH